MDSLENAHRSTGSVEDVLALREVLVVDVSAIVALVALTRREELARLYLVRCRRPLFLWPLALVTIVVVVAVIALPLGSAIGLLVVLRLHLRLHLRLINRSILHLLRPCSRLILLLLGRESERKRGHADWQRWRRGKST
jgi:hypothetical protein